LRRVIFLVSTNWLGSGWCTKEYALARGLNKKLFAALTDPTRTIGSLPQELTGVWQIVDLVHGQDLRLFPAQPPGSNEERHIGYSQSGLTRLKRGLEKAGLDARFFPWPPEREPDRAPYRGLKSQEADDAAIFFGRDAQIVDAIDRLRGLRAGSPPRLMAILGASGAGKSSFLRAGLLPRLNRDYAQFIPLPVVRPGRAALTGETGLVNAVAAILPARSRAELRTAVHAGAGALRPLLAELVQAAAARRDPGDESERPPAFVVAIDQAEELFRAEGREESESLLALLAQLAAGDDPTVIVIFTIRSHSYDALQSAKALEGLRQVAFSLLPMPRGAYHDVIEGPARRVEEAGGKLAIEPALTQRLLIDIEAGAGDALPLLAFTLEQLYLDYRQTGALRLVDYEKFGGIKGAIDAAVERALVRADADPRIPRDREARLALLRRGLIPWLAGVDPDTKTPRRNIARRADIPAEAAPLIDLLVEERLLSVDTRVSRDSKTGDETRESTIEPTHEALLRQWGLLDGWLTEDLGLLATLEGVKRAARDWDANARGDSWLAHQGQRLAEAFARDGRPDIAARLDETDRAYLDEAEQLANEVLKTYPNQMSTRFMIDLIRHGNMQLDAAGSTKTSRESRRTAKETALEAAFGNGFGRFRLGMTPVQVNELAGNPYDISQLPRAYEYTTDDVRYFWLLVSQVPDFQTFYKGASCLRNRAAGYRDSAGRHDSDYAAFLFHENALIRISLRFEGQTQPGCPDRSKRVAGTRRALRDARLGDPRAVAAQLADLARFSIRIYIQRRADAGYRLALTAPRESAAVRNSDFASAA
jgi:Novel STAND NTPase 1